MKGVLQTFMMSGSRSWMSRMSRSPGGESQRECPRTIRTAWLLSILCEADKRILHKDHPKLDTTKKKKKNL